MGVISSGIVDQHPEEQRLVAVVQRREVDVLVEIGLLAAEVLEHALELLFLREHARRQQATQAERVPLRFGKRGAFVLQGVVQHSHPVG